MKKPVRTTLIVVLLTAVSVATLRLVAAAPGVGPEWQPAGQWQGSWFIGDMEHREPMTYDPLLLALGRTVYADLQRARQAALEKQSTNLMVALGEAEDTLNRLQMPPEVMALDAQLQVIRNDLKDKSKSMDQQLWVPVSAEIDDVLVYASDQTRKQAREAVSQARESAGKGDRQRVRNQLDVVSGTLEYGLGVFPLDKVKEDIESARASADLSNPDWTGALEAVQSALATFHWYTGEPAHGLINAYNAAVKAYVLESKPAFRSHQEQLSIHYLEQARNSLAAMPHAKRLADEADAIIAMAPPPPPAAIRTLLNNIQVEIRQQRKAAENSYWKSIGHALKQPVQ